MYLCCPCSPENADFWVSGQSWLKDELSQQFPWRPHESSQTCNWLYCTWKLAFVKQDGASHGTGPAVSFDDFDMFLETVLCFWRVGHHLKCWYVKMLRAFLKTFWEIWVYKTVVSQLWRKPTTVAIYFLYCICFRHLVPLCLKVRDLQCCVKGTVWNDPQIESGLGKTRPHIFWRVAVLVP